MKINKNIKSGLFWSFTQQIINQIISFGISIILARILMPKDFGIIGMIYVFMTFGNLILDAGMSLSLIRTQNIKSIDYNTVFISNICFAVFLFLSLFFSAPYIAIFYEQPILTNVIRVISFSFIFIAFSTIQNAILIKNLQFKKLLFISIPSNFIGGFIGILFALWGYGVWSLVITSLVTLGLTSIFLWIVSDWKPKFVFDKEIFKKHFFYGYKLTLTNFINATYTNSYLVLIGKQYSANQVGYYSRADSIRNISVYSILTALNRVSFPVIASLQINTTEFNKTYKYLIQSVFFIITPILISLAVLAKPLFIFLFTTKWLFAVPYFQILILSSIFFTLNSVNTSVLSSIGKSNLVLKIEVIKLIFAILTIVLAFSFGIIWLLYTQVFLSIVDFIIICFFIKKVFYFPIKKYLMFILKVIIIAIISAGFIHLLDVYLERINSYLFLRLLIGTTLYFGCYITIAKLFNFEILLKLYNDLVLNKNKY